MIYGQRYVERYANFFYLSTCGHFWCRTACCTKHMALFRYLHLREIKTETYGANLGRKQQVSTCLNRVVFVLLLVRSHVCFNARFAFFQ